MKSGVVFLTDPPYGFKKFDDAPEKEQPFNGVYRVAKDGTRHRRRERTASPERRRAVAR